MSLFSTIWNQLEMFFLAYFELGDCEWLADNYANLILLLRGISVEITIASQSFQCRKQFKMNAQTRSISLPTNPNVTHLPHRVFHVQQTLHEGVQRNYETSTVYGLGIVDWNTPLNCTN